MDKLIAKLDTFSISDAKQKGSALDEVMCPICLSILYNPIMLSCNHVFCKHCIENFMKTLITDSEHLDNKEDKKNSNSKITLTCAMCRAKDKFIYTKLTHNKKLQKNSGKQIPKRNERKKEPSHHRY